MTVQPPAPPYTGPPFRSSGTGNKPINRVVIHCTVSACCTSAKAIADYFKSSRAGGSAHYITDASTTLQSAWDSVVCWHAPPNSHSIGVEMCCTLADEGRGHWERADHQTMMRRTAELVAQLCLAYGVPIVKLSPADLKAGKHGICGHVDVSQAWRQSSHWDPGPHFPWEQFMGMVRAAAKDLTDEPEPPKPPADSKPARVRVTAWNAGDGSDESKRKALHRLAERSDVICLSEWGDRRDVPPAPGMKRWHGDLPGAASTPIDYRPDLFEPGTITTGCEYLTGAVVVGRRGPGPSKLKPKVANWVRGQLKGNGRWARFVSEHGVPAPHLNDAREAVGDEQIDDLADLFGDEWHGEGLAVLAGDLNRDANDPDLDRLEAAGMTRVSTGPTHGKRAIDHIFVKMQQGGDKRVTKVEARVRPGGSSDHDAPWVALTVSAKP